MRKVGREPMLSAGTTDASAEGDCEAGSWKGRRRSQGIGKSTPNAESWHDSASAEGVVEPDVAESHCASHAFMRSVACFLRLVHGTGRKPLTSPGTTGTSSARTGKSSDTVAHKAETERTPLTSLCTTGASSAGAGKSSESLAPEASSPPTAARSVTRRLTFAMCCQAAWRPTRWGRMRQKVSFDSLGDKGMETGETSAESIS